MASGSNSRKGSNLVLSTDNPVIIEVVAISPDRLLNGKMYECDTCSKRFLREQNLQFHGRAHNHPFTLRRNSSKDTKKVYVCPEPTCIHHNPSHALKDMGGLKKHFSRKHVTEKNHKCDTCSKAYAAEVDLKAHSKVCGKKKHKCSCGMEFQKKCDLKNHMDHNCSSGTLNGATNHLSRNGLGNNLANVTTSNHTHSFLIGSTSSNRPPTFNMEHNSARITTYHNNITLTPHIPLVQATSNSYPNISHYESKLYDFQTYQGSHMTNHFMGSNSFQTLHASSFPSIQQNPQDFQNKFTEGSYWQMLRGDTVSIDNFDLNNNFNGGGFYGQESVPTTSLNATMDNGYGGGERSFDQDYGHGYWG